MHARVYACMYVCILPYADKTCSYYFGTKYSLHPEFRKLPFTHLAWAI